MAPNSLQNHRILQIVSQSSASLLSEVMDFAAAVRWILRHKRCRTCRYLGHGRTFHAVAHEFKIGKSTAVSIVYEVCRAIRAELWNEACAKPTRASFAESAAGFQSLWSYPRGISAIDGKHFQCVAPPRSGSSYYNYKGTFSVVLLIVVDSHYKILLIDCGSKGKISDSGLFRTSSIKTFLESSRELFPPAAPLGNHGIVEFHILGDGGFPQFTWLQRPYQQGEAFQDIRKAHFNMCFSSARRIVENVFGIICSRFRVFQAPLYGSPEHVKLIILTACGCGLKWSPDKQYLASGGIDNQLLIWSMRRTNASQTFTEHSAAVKALGWSPHHHGLLVSRGGTSDRHLRFSNTLTGQPIQAIDKGSQVCNVAWSKHSSELVPTHECSLNKPVTKLSGHQFRVLYLAMSPDGKSIVTSAGDETLRFRQSVWIAASSQEQTEPLSQFAISSEFANSLRPVSRAFLH